MAFPIVAAAKLLGGQMVKKTAAGAAKKALTGAAKNAAKNKAKNFITGKKKKKGAIVKAQKGEIPNLTGINSPYEEPKDPSLIVDTDEYDPQKAVDLIVNYLKEKKCI